MQLSKLTALAGAAALLAAAGAAHAAKYWDWYIPHDKPIHSVTYYTDGRPIDDAEVSGVYVQYCDLTTYQAGSLTLYPHTEPYLEC